MANTGYPALLEICRGMREAAALEAWDRLAQLNRSQIELLKSLPPPTPADRKALAEALADLQEALGNTSACRVQMADLLAPFDGTPAEGT